MVAPLHPAAETPLLHIRPGVAAVIRDAAGRILLHRRRLGGGWAPPSGSVEPGEDLCTALHREIREETNLQVTVERLVGVYSDPAFQVVQYPDGHAVQYITCLFACHPSGGNLTGSAEGTAWAWFDPRALPDPLTPFGRVWLRDALAGREGPVIC